MTNKYELLDSFQDVSTLKMYTSRKTFVVKLLVGACLVYLCVHVLSNTGAPIIRELQESGRSLAALDSSALEAELKDPLPMVEPTKTPMIAVKDIESVVSVCSKSFYIWIVLFHKIRFKLLSKDLKFFQNIFCTFMENITVGQ